MAWHGSCCCLHATCHVVDGPIVAHRRSVSVNPKVLNPVFGVCDALRISSHPGAKIFPEILAKAEKLGISATVSVLEREWGLGVKGFGVCLV